MTQKYFVKHVIRRESKNVMWLFLNKFFNEEIFFENKKNAETCSAFFRCMRYDYFL